MSELTIQSDLIDKIIAGDLSTDKALAALRELRDQLLSRVKALDAVIETMTLDEARWIESAMVRAQAMRDLETGKPVHLEGLAQDGHLYKIEEENVM